MDRHSAETDRRVRTYWRLTALLLGCNVLLFVLATVFISANPIWSLVFGGLNVVALSLLVWVDRRAVRRGVATFWRDGRLQSPPR